MPPISILIKPASGHCNMRCRYCFYADEIGKRETSLYPVMSYATLEAIIRKTLEYAEKECSIGFQGGEPTLAGLGFFQEVVALQKKYNKNNVSIHNFLQSNGLLLDDEWAAFFKQNGFLVGLSMDGHHEINDLNRIDAAGKGTLTRILNAAKLLKRHQVDFNVLSVVTAQSARSIQKIYHFFQKNGFLYQQYIPCLDPLGEERGSYPYSLAPEAYGKFLITLFDLWYEDVSAGKFVYIRYFENLVGMLRGFPPESCGLAGCCTNQHVIEADGSVYPCDFYMLDEFLIGNLNTDSFPQIHENLQHKGFVAASIRQHPECMSCQWNRICHGGCRRDRQGLLIPDIGKNYYCSAFKTFFAHAVPKLVHLLEKQDQQRRKEQMNQFFQATESGRYQH